MKEIVRFIKTTIDNPRRSASLFLFGCVILCAISICVALICATYLENHNSTEHTQFFKDVYIIGGGGIFVLLLVLLFINVSYLFD